MKRLKETINFNNHELVGIRQGFLPGKGWVDLNIEITNSTDPIYELKELVKMGYKKVNLICRNNEDYFPEHCDFYPDYAISELIETEHIEDIRLKLKALRDNWHRLETVIEIYTPEFKKGLENLAGRARDILERI